MKLEISLYQFNAKSDYLPYYTKHYVTLNEQKSLLDILNTIALEHDFGYENDASFGVVLNGVYTPVNLDIQTMIQMFGKTLKIEPLSIRLSYKDLLIDNSEFYQKLELLPKELVDSKLKEQYNSYQLHYFSSNSINHHKKYIGDALILVCASLLQSELSTTNIKAIHDVLLDNSCGIMYHTSLKNRLLQFDDNIEKTILELQKNLGVFKPMEEQNFRVKHTKIIDFGKPCGSSIVKHSFKGFNIAYYHGSKSNKKTQSLLQSLEANILNLATLSNDLALQTFHINPDFTYKLVSEVMLDAFDNAADFIVVDDEALFYLFDYNRKELERVCGREVILPVIHTLELSKLVCGLHDEVKKILEQHCINPELV
jgi:succinate dehydrogenase/fumarate reductase-like Fe-S protein